MARQETTLEQDEYIRRHGSSMSASEIQRAIGLSRKIVKRRADEMKVELKRGRPPGLPPSFDWESVDWSMSNAKIAEMLGCSAAAVKRTRLNRKAGSGERSPNKSRGLPREYSESHIEKMRHNASIGREAALKSPLAGRHEQNCHAIEWALVSPSGDVYRVRNLHQFIRQNPHLFNADDVIWKRSGKRQDAGSGIYCNASSGIIGIRAGRSRQWKGWRLLED